MHVCRMQVLTFVLVALVGAATARAQTLAVQGDRFTVNGQGKFLLFASYFDAMHAITIIIMKFDIFQICRFGK